MGRHVESWRLGLNHKAHLSGLLNESWLVQLKCTEIIQFIPVWCSALLSLFPVSPDWLFYQSPVWTLGFRRSNACDYAKLHLKLSVKAPDSTLLAPDSSFNSGSWKESRLIVVNFAACVQLLLKQEKKKNRCQRINRGLQSNTCRCRQSGVQPLFWELIYSLAPGFMLFHLLIQLQPKWIVIILSASSY